MTQPIYQTLIDLQQSPKSTLKVEILKRDDWVGLRSAVQAALHPLWTYGVKKLPDVKSQGQSTLFTHAGPLLRQLRTRALTGNAAQAEIARILELLTFEDGEVLRRILLKDLRCGVDAKTANKAFPGLIPIYSTMLAHPFDITRVREWPVMLQPKLDGVRVLVHIGQRPDDVKFLSRSGREFDSFDSLKQVVWDAADTFELHGHVLDGEVTDGDFLATVSAVRRRGVDKGTSVFNVFDVLPAAAFHEGKHDVPAQVRYYRDVQRLLEHHPRLQVVPTILAETEDEIWAEYRRIRAAGGEGVMVKRRDAPYVCARSYDWMKIKDCQSVDLQVHGVQPGTGKYAGQVGALLCYFGDVEVAVGSGLPDGLRLFDKKHLIGRTIEVQYHEVTPAGSLRHPRFVKMRDTLTGAHE